jgi:hypothetical protein
MAADFAHASCLAGDDDRVDRLVGGVLLDLAKAGRRAVRIVHAGCGSGAILVRAIVRARVLGFVAIEARGSACSADSIVIARWATSDWHDPRVGLVFEVAALEESLAREDERSVDLLLCSRQALQSLSPPARAQAAGTIRRIADRLVVTGDR